MTKVAILTIFRDESHIMYEWCKYHLNFGFDHLFMINNNSKDDYQQVLNNLDNEKITVFHEKGSKIQSHAIKKYYKLIYNKYDWIYITDLDEFIYFNNPKLKLTDFLDEHDSHIHTIHIRWKIFLPSQFVQPKSVIENNNIWCLPAGISTDALKLESRGKVKYHHGKSITRTCVQPNDISHHRPLISPNNIKIYNLTDNIVQINHYRYNSWEFMLGIKLSRGGGQSGIKRWAFNKNIEKTFRFNLGRHNNTVDNTLKDQCHGYIKNIKDRPRTPPKVSIYNNPYYNKINKYLNDNPHIQPVSNNKKSILKFNRHVIQMITKMYIKDKGSPSTNIRNRCLNRFIKNTIHRNHNN